MLKASKPSAPNIPLSASWRSRGEDTGPLTLGVIAWSRYADPAAGKYGEPEEFLRLGAIPEWFDAGGRS